MSDVSGIRIPQEQARGRHVSSASSSSPAPISERLRSASSSGSASASAWSSSSSALPYSAASSPLTTVPSSPVTVTSTSSAALGPNGAQWFYESKASDLVFATSQALHAFEQRYAPVQGYAHAPDDYFPPAAARFGLKQVDPFEYDPQALRTMASRLKNHGRIRCGRDAHCLVCGAGGRLPAFLYTHGDPGAQQCVDAARAGFPTLLFRWAKDGKCRRCLYCASHRTRCSLQDLPLLRTAPAAEMTFFRSTASSSDHVSPGGSGDEDDTPGSPATGYTDEPAVAVSESSQDSRRPPTKRRSTADEDDTERSRRPRDGDDAHSLFALTPDFAVLMLDRDRRHSLQPKTPVHQDSKPVLLPDTTPGPPATATEVADLKLALARAQAKIAELQPQVADSDSACAALQQERDDANAQRTRAEAASRQHVARIAELEAQLAAANSAQATAERERDDAVVQNASRAEADTGKQELSAQVAELQARLAESNASNAALGRERDAAVAERARVEAEVGRLVLALPQGQAEAGSRLREELEVERARVAERDWQLKSERARVAELEAGRAGRDDELAVARARLAERDNELAACGVVIEEQTEKIRRLEAECADLEGDLSKAMSVKPMLDTWLFALVMVLEEKAAEVVDGGGAGGVAEDVQMGHQEWLARPSSEEG